jgi:hypothetical protein
MAAILPVMYGVRHYDLKKFFAGRAPTVFKREFLFKTACSTATNAFLVPSPTGCMRSPPNSCGK